MTLEEHIRTEYESAVTELDGVAEPFQFWRVGYHRGLHDGQTIKNDLETVLREQQHTIGWQRGYAQGLARAAWVASHTSTVDINAAMTPAQAAASMRESITAAVQVAASEARIRAEA